MILLVTLCIIALMSPSLATAPTVDCTIQSQCTANTYCPADGGVYPVDTSCTATCSPTACTPGCRSGASVGLCANCNVYCPTYCTYGQQCVDYCFQTTDSATCDANPNCQWCNSGVPYCNIRSVCAASCPDITIAAFCTGTSACQWCNAFAVCISSNETCPASCLGFYSDGKACQSASSCTFCSVTGLCVTTGGSCPVSCQVVSFNICPFNPRCMSCTAVGMCAPKSFGTCPASCLVFRDQSNCTLSAACHWCPSLQYCDDLAYSCKQTCETLPSNIVCSAVSTCTYCTALKYCTSNVLGCLSTCSQASATPDLCMVALKCQWCSNVTACASHTDVCPGSCTSSLMTPSVCQASSSCRWCPDLQYCSNTSSSVACASSCTHLFSGADCNNTGGACLWCDVLMYCVEATAPPSVRCAAHCTGLDSRNDLCNSSGVCHYCPPVGSAPRGHCKMSSLKAELLMSNDNVWIQWRQQTMCRTPTISHSDSHALTLSDATLSVSRSMATFHWTQSATPTSSFQASQSMPSGTATITLQSSATDILSVSVESPSRSASRSLTMSPSSSRGRRHQEESWSRRLTASHPSFSMSSSSCNVYRPCDTVDIFSKNTVNDNASVATESSSLTSPWSMKTISVTRSIGTRLGYLLLTCQQLPPSAVFLEATASVESGTGNPSGYIVLPLPTVSASSANTTTTVNQSSVRNEVTVNLETLSQFIRQRSAFQSVTLHIALTLRCVVENRPIRVSIDVVSSAGLTQSVITTMNSVGGIASIIGGTPAASTMASRLFALSAMANCPSNPTTVDSPLNLALGSEDLSRSSAIGAIVGDAILVGGVASMVALFAVFLAYSSGVRHGLLSRVHMPSIIAPVLATCLCPNVMAVIVLISTTSGSTDGSGAPLPLTAGAWICILVGVGMVALALWVLVVPFAVHLFVGGLPVVLVRCAPVKRAAVETRLGRAWRHLASFADRTWKWVPRVSQDKEYSNPQHSSGLGTEKQSRRERVLAELEWKWRYLLIIQDSREVWYPLLDGGLSVLVAVLSIVAWNTTMQCQTVSWCIVVILGLQLVIVSWRRPFCSRFSISFNVLLLFDVVLAATCVALTLTLSSPPSVASASRATEAFVGIATVMNTIRFVRDVFDAIRILKSALFGLPTKTRPNTDDSKDGLLLSEEEPSEARDHSPPPPGGSEYDFLALPMSIDDDDFAVVLASTADVAVPSEVELEGSVRGEMSVMEFATINPSVVSLMNELSAVPHDSTSKAEDELTLAFLQYTENK